MSNATHLAPTPRRITGRMVLGGLLGFFAVVLIVNGIFIFMALDSWPGLATDRPYERGIHYNRTLSDARAQASLGWQSRLTYGDDIFRVRLTARNGSTITGATIELTLKRPASSKFDRQLRLNEFAPGDYRAPLTALPAGLWRGNLVVVGRGGQHYRMQHDLVVQP